MFATHMRSRRGAVLIFSLILVFITGIIIMSLLGMTSHQTRMVHRHEIRQIEFAAAETALNKVYAEIRHFLAFGTGNISLAIASITPPTLDDIAYTEFDITEMGSQFELIDSGPFQGLTLYTTHYKVELTAVHTGARTDLLDHPGVSIRQDLKVRYVPLFIYGIFYDSDLEIHPGPPFVESGRVHTNSNLYVGSNDRATFNSHISAHGEIHHALHPLDTHHGSVGSGDILYTDGTTAISDDTALGHLDHDHLNWASESLARWDGHVLDSAHGMPSLPLPIPDAEDPHVLIEPAHVDDPISVADIKFENQADLVIEVDPSTYAVAGYDSNGFSVDLEYDHDANPGTPDIPIYEISTFRDNREGHDVTTVDIDMQRLSDSGLDPSNGILYVNAETGVRLVNGAELPANLSGGFTVATNGPLYVVGDYNSVNTKLSLIACDALNIMSNAWDDANSTNWSARNAIQSEVKSVVMSGNVPTDADTPYSGGVENYFRFHENWSGVTFTFAGSIINLWDSEIATANWSYGNPVYTAPNRDWDWDIIYGGLAGPPGMPRVYYIDRLEWHEVNPNN